MRTIAATLLVCALSLGVTWAQSQATSQIQGTVLDASGAPVPGAQVKVTQTDTGISRAVSTGTDGTYVLPNLAIGPYRLEVSKSGFSTYVQTGIVLQVATNPTVDVSLKIGAVNEQVQVEANAALVETQATGVGNVMETQRIVELPLNGRVATDLVQYTGAAIPLGVAGNGGYPEHTAVLHHGRTGVRRWVLAGRERVQQSVGSGEHAASFPRRAGGV